MTVTSSVLYMYIFDTKKNDMMRAGGENVSESSADAIEKKLALCVVTTTLN